MAPKSGNPNNRPIEKVDFYPDKSVYQNYTFSSYVRAGDFIFANFQSGGADNDIEGQTERCFRNLEKTLKAAGATLNDVVKVTVLIKNREDFQKMNDVYRRQFADGYPARITMIVADFLDTGMLIQIDAVAYKPR